MSAEAAMLRRIQRLENMAFALRRRMERIGALVAGGGGVAATWATIEGRPFRPYATGATELTVDGGFVVYDGELTVGVSDAVLDVSSILGDSSGRVYFYLDWGGSDSGAVLGAPTIIGASATLENPAPVNTANTIRYFQMGYADVSGDSITQITDTMPWMHVWGPGQCQIHGESTDVGEYLQYSGVGLYGWGTPTLADYYGVTDDDGKFLMWDNTEGDFVLSFPWPVGSSAWEDIHYLAWDADAGEASWEIP